MALAWSFPVVQATEEQPASFTLRYQFTGQDDGDLHESGMWVPLEQNDDPGCDEAPILPCVVEFETSEFVDIETFYNSFDDIDDLMTNGSDYIKSTKSGS